MSNMFDDWHRPISKSIRWPATVGVVMFAVLVGGIGVWSTTAPLASAAVAGGQFVAVGQNKTIQHFEGGIIHEILVNEGQQVAAGQDLILLDDTASRAEARRYELKRFDLLANAARLDAVRLSSERVKFPPDIVAANGEPEVANIIEVQNSVFSAGREAFIAQQTITERQVNAIEEQILGLEAQKGSNEAQLKLLNDELFGAEQLYAQGLTQLSRVLQLKRGSSKLAGDIGQIVSEIGKARQNILESQSTLVGLKKRTIEEAVAEHKTVSSELADTEEKLIAVRDVLKRSRIIAPVNGIVIKLNYHSPGAVIGSGQPIMDILPIDEKLIVEAMINVQDIDNIRVGLDAELRFSTLNMRTTPIVSGKVTYVSADKLQAKDQQRPYYLARITVDDKALRLAIGDQLTPGLPAEVYIKTGERTLLQYILKPIKDSMARGLNES